MYLKPSRLQISIFLSKILRQIYIYGMAGYKYMVYYSQYKAEDVFMTCLVADTCFSI